MEVLVALLIMFLVFLSQVQHTPYDSLFVQKGIFRSLALRIDETGYNTHHRRAASFACTDGVCRNTIGLVFVAADTDIF